LLALKPATAASPVGQIVTTKYNDIR